MTEAKPVWRDLYPPAEAHALELRSQLLMALNEWLEQSGLTQAAAAKQLGVDQPRVSDIKKGKISRFTIDRLVEMSTRAGLKVSLELQS